MTYDEFLQTLPELAKNYKPATEALEQLRAVTLLMVIGPSGVGKTTLVNKLSIPYVPSDTTRPIRPHEASGKDMYFLTDYDKVVSDINTGEFVQVAIGASGDLYATRASSYPASGLAVMPVMADVVPIFRGLGFASTTTIFVVPPSFDEWMRRMDSHKLTDEQLQKRLAEAKRSLSFALHDPETHFILNDTIENALVQINNLLDGRIDQKLANLARQTAEQNLERISN